MMNVWCTDADALALADADTDSCKTSCHDADDLVLRPEYEHIPPQGSAKPSGTFKLGENPLRKHGEIPTIF